MSNRASVRNPRQRAHSSTATTPPSRPPYQISPLPPNTLPTLNDSWFCSSQ